jgi:16S rRNA (guanine966-N2)-methyltransferase
MPVRPTTDAMRERAFAVLADRLQGARFLDLFAGTGAVGLEALSRGAAEVVLVEQHRATARLITANRDALQIKPEQARVLVRPAHRALRELASRKQQFQLAWSDPPFEQWLSGLEALVSAFDLGVLAADATACLECPADAALAEMEQALEVERELPGGASRVVLLRLEARPEPPFVARLARKS